MADWCLPCRSSRGFPSPGTLRNRRFFTLDAAVLLIRASAGSSRRPSRRVDVDRGQLVYPSPGRRRDRKCTCTISPQSVGGPRAGEIGGGSSGSPTAACDSAQTPLACFTAAGPSMAPAASGGRSQSRGLARPPRQPPAGRCRCFRGGGTRSASRSRNSNRESSTTPLAPGRVDFRPRPGPTQLAALCRGST